MTNAVVRAGGEVRAVRLAHSPGKAAVRAARRDDRVRGNAIVPHGSVARPLAVESNRPGTATGAARTIDYSRAVDDARCLQSGVERDPQLALSRSRKRRKASVRLRWPPPKKRASRLPRRRDCRGWRGRSSSRRY